MAIYRLLKTLPMRPEEIAVLTDAYEHTLRKLNLVERSDPITQLIAKRSSRFTSEASAIRKNFPSSLSRSLGSSKEVTKPSSQVTDGLSEQKADYSPKYLDQ